MNNFETRVLLAYHLYQYADLRSDILNAGVKVYELDCWQEGYNSDAFCPGMVVDAPKVVYSDTQHNAYIKAMGYHSDRAAALVKELGFELINVDGELSGPKLSGLNMAFYRHGNGNLCSTFKFGTEPTAREILVYVLSINLD
jgi:hypothetical protein